MKKRAYILGGIIFLVILVLILFFRISGKPICVPSGCCHATSCVLESEAPNCSERLCSMSCEPNTLDCGQGHCEYIDGNCEAILDE